MIELGAVLWVLMGWRLLIAELAGAIVLIALMWALLRAFLPKDVETEIRARTRDQEVESHCHSHHSRADHELAEANPADANGTRKWT